MAYEIATIPGDGIGPEVVDVVQPLFTDVGSSFGFSFEFTQYSWGTERYLEMGSMMPDDALNTLEGYDAILLGAVGHPDVPDHVTLYGQLLPIRKWFDQGICKRPAVLFDGIESPLADYSGGDIDFVVYRENTEREYSDIGGREHHGFDNEIDHGTARSAVVKPSNAPGRPITRNELAVVGFDDCAVVVDNFVANQRRFDTPVTSRPS